jgi:bifunctional UDP-N-acetylglucosamine pyrophosphorylase/glucosamine-1-phosphate N-acetyltransferase
MKVVFLAGGIGKRMLPVTTDKSLIKFCGKELILHQLEKARAAGFKDAVIIGSPLNIGQMKQVCGEAAEYAVQKEANGMAGALQSARELIAGEEILIMGANEVFEPKAFEDIKKKKGDAAILGYQVEKYFPGGYLVTDGDRMKGIVEKPGEGKEPSDLVNLVFHMHRDTDALLKAVDKTPATSDDVYERAMDSLVKAGKDYRVVPYKGFWGPIKFAHHILPVMEHFLDNMKERISDSAQVNDRATIKGKVFIDDGARVFESAVVNGPAYIGKGCIVGNGSLVRTYTDLEARSVVGYSTEVKGSYIGEDCWFHSNYVGDSVIMSGTMMGSGSVTANFRFDEKNVYTMVNGQKQDTGRNKFGCIIGENAKTGVNSTIYPGVKIGANTFIGPGIVLREDIDANKVILLKSQEFDVRENTVKRESDKKLELMKKLTSKH